MIISIKNKSTVSSRSLQPDLLMTSTATESPLTDIKFARFSEDSTPFRNILRGEHQGPSPWADKQTEGPSVLHSYKPLRASGKLEKTYKFSDVTPGLGREFYEQARLADILEDAELLRDLAITISERGVVFFKNQHDLTVEQQKRLADRLGQVAGKPKSAGLHVHPTAFTNAAVDPKSGEAIPEVLVLDSKLGQMHLAKAGGIARGLSGGGFHSDITFEPVPASYAVLRLKETPSRTPDGKELANTQAGPVGGNGGDTLWASGYGLAEKVSPEFLKYLESLSGQYTQPSFSKVTAGANVPFWSGERGAPENVGTELTAKHPLVRTNPVTGWKSIFAIGAHFTGVNGVSARESDFVRRYLLELLYTSPEIQLRYKWSPYDIAIWDNRSTYHSIIADLELSSPGAPNRVGLRTLSLGERPFLDANSKLRRDDLETRDRTTRLCY